MMRIWIAVFIAAMLWAQDPKAETPPKPEQPKQITQEQRDAAQPIIEKLVAAQRGLELIQRGICDQAEIRPYSACVVDWQRGLVMRMAKPEPPKPVPPKREAAK